MGNLPGRHTLEHILAQDGVTLVPDVFVELGTFEGKTAALAAEIFPHVHTVELSPEYHAKAKAAYENLIGVTGGGIHFYLGDSREVLPRLAAEINEPAVFYHDAHWWPYPGVAQSFPLWDDLKTIAARPFADIIIVDEVHRFGDVLPTANWRDVSLERIAACFPDCRDAVILGNLAVVYR